MTFDEKFLSNLAGWRAMKEARGILAADRVLSSDWNEPLLKGVVQAGSTTYRAGLFMKSERDIENICTCRESRQWGKICAHSVAVGLHHLQPARKIEDPSASHVSAPPPGTERKSPRPVASWLKRTVDGQSDRPLALALILPPNLAASLEKGRLMVYAQATAEGRTTPLNAADRATVYGVSGADAQILDALERITEGQVPAAVAMDLSQFLEFLPLLRNHPRITLGKDRPIRVVDEPWAPPLRARLLESGEIVLEQQASGNAPEPDWIGRGWVFTGSEFRPLGLPPGLAGLQQKSMTLPRVEVPRFLHQDWPVLARAQAVEADFALEDFELANEPPEFRLHLSGGMAMLDARLECAYGARSFRPGTSEEPLFLPDPNKPTHYWVRDLSAEQEAAATLTRAGFAGPDKQGTWSLRGQDSVLDFLAGVYPRLRRDWNVTLAERLQSSTERNLEWVEPSFEATPSGVQWFDLSVSYQGSGGQVVSSQEVQRLLQSGRRHAKLSNGKAMLMDTESLQDFQEALRDCAPQQREGTYRMAGTQAAFLRNSIREGGWRLRGPSDWMQEVDRQTGESKPVCPPLGDLEEVMRPYQKDGVAWFDFLVRHRFGGILADEMGLGKTLQTLAFLRHLKQARREAGEDPLPCLVVCPASLVENWVNETAKFTPSLKTLALHGPNRRALFEAVPASDLVITSYGLIRRDEERHAGQEYDVVVLDEAQHIKNRQTQNAQAVKAVRGRHRFVLTGTPMENSVLDLWSIFDFLMPGYLGSARDFRERYEMPITRERCVKAQARLARRVRPFLLRRLKRDVAAELPEKIEQVAWCDMTDEQQRLYRQVLEASRRELLPAVRPGQGPNRMAVLSALLRLRQICCDPRLLKLEGEPDAIGSGKMDMFGELLDEVLDGGHRVLVFSQFVSMLTLIRQKLESDEIGYCYLDGSTRDRLAEVERFQKDGSIPVFLISLKAGGVGLNLTGADTVIHFDPWWNPAVEAQATDRAHRIGQSRVVTSYKLISRGTVEEKILQLQATKQERTAATLDGEGALAETLSWEEIQGLLA